MNCNTTYNKSSIEVMKVKHGDCFIIHCFKGGEEGIIVIDGGPTKCRTEVKRKLKNIGCIDLMILTHFDDDHIGGILEYVKEYADAPNFPVRELWVNCAKDIECDTNVNISYSQASRLDHVLNKISKASEAEWKENICCGYMKSFAYADITVIAPTKVVQGINYQEYKYYLENLSDLNCSGTHKVSPDASIKFEDLAQRTKISPSTSNLSNLINMASICAIIECDNLKLLMLGDSYPQDIIDSLTSIGYSNTNKLKIDYVKISHHGSRNNTSNELLDLIDCDNFIISTNGGMGRSSHPSRETIANILCHQERNINRIVNLHFNYDVTYLESRCGTLFKDDETEKYNFTIQVITDKLYGYE